MELNNSKAGIHFRKVNKDDLRLLFDWANDDEVRNNSLSTNKISIEEHTKWFNKRIDSVNAQFYILEYNSIPAGLVKFEYDDSELAWIIGYSVSKDFRNLGLGRKLLSNGINSLGKLPVIGYVKPDNIKSLKIFEALGFRNDGLQTVKGATVIRFTKFFNPE
ncbi:MAG: N-acetyltransferase [Flavobacterium sp.]|nr:MAG: N-acetyltransferase [Flavobacterium sp.]